MRIEVNGESREVADEISLRDLVVELSLTPERVAIERNQEVVRRTDWPATIIAEGDRLEIVHFVGGGGDIRQEQTAGSRKLNRWRCCV